MITLERQQNLFLAVAKKLKRKIEAYAIGGTAMMFLGLKDTTLDIDLVFENDKDKNTFKEAIKAIGYREMDAIKIYGARRNRPEMLTLGDEQFDLFVVKVVNFVFSESMRQRAEAMHQFDDKLVLKIANPHDLILMKCATDRQKDLDDVRKIINEVKINWSLIIEEAKKQISLGESRAAFELGYFLEKLNNDLGVKISQEVLNELFEIVKKQAEEKQKKK